MTGKEILGLPMGRNDAGAGAIHEYFKSLLSAVLQEEEGFSGKRPFGNSGWKNELYQPLVEAGLIQGDDDGSPLTQDDFKEADSLLLQAVLAL